MHFKTFGDLIRACMTCKTKEDAAVVINKAEEDNPGYTRENIGYLLGYIEPPEERKRLYALFKNCNHPIFGRTFGREGVPQ